MNNKLPNPNLEYSEALSLDLEEAALAFTHFGFISPAKDLAASARTPGVLKASSIALSTAALATTKVLPVFIRFDRDIDRVTERP
ncbi:MAG: hypothetical protein IPK73_21190 [Candidatus Obscuribacter sp.]|nr:hypothetical protein [Candidatus Obscuribacter sp.]